MAAMMAARMVADVGGLHGAGLGAGLGAAVPGLAGEGAGRDLPPGQGPDLGVQQRLVALHDGDVMRCLVLDQPGQAGPHGMEGVEGHHGAVQVHRFQQFGEVAGLVVPDANLEMIQEVPAVLGDAEQLHPGAVFACQPARRAG
jgi:hypothetical protein